MPIRPDGTAPRIDCRPRRAMDGGMKRYAASLLLTLTLSSALRADSSAQWFWHGAFPWVYSHDESFWWYMKAGTDGKFYAWKQGDEKWYSFDEAARRGPSYPGRRKCRRRF